MQFQPLKKEPREAVTQLLGVEMIAENILKFKKHKTLSDKIDLEKRFNDNPKKAERCGKCGSLLGFDVYRNIQSGELKKILESANFCDVRWCPLCAWRKSLKLAGELKSVFEQIEAQQGVKYLFLTLTIKNPPLTELRASIKQMSEAFNRLTQQDRFKDNILGYIRAIEYLGDNTKSGEAHPHFHTILLVSSTRYTGKKYIPQKEWVRMWRKALRVDYDPVVDIRQIRSKNSQWKDTDSAIFETLKYCVAPQELRKLSQKDFKELDKQTKGTRQYNKGGLVKSTEPLPTAGLSEEEWEYLHTELLRWQKSQKDYEKCLELKKDRHSSNQSE